MAEKEVVWNKTLLLVAFLLGVLAAVLFFAYDRSMQKKLSGDMVTLFVWRDDYERGRPVTRSHVKEVRMRRETAAGWGNALGEAELPLLKTRLARDVRKEDLVRTTDILAWSRDSPESYLHSGMVAAFLRVDPNSAPGDMLRVNSRVNVYGLLSVPGKGARPYAILKNVRVISVGGSSADPDEGVGVRRRTGRSYRSVGIEVTEETALDIMGVLAMIRGGKIWVMPRSRPAPGEEDEPSAELTPEVARLVRKFLDDGIDE